MQANDINNLLSDAFGETQWFNPSIVLNNMLNKQQLVSPYSLKKAVEEESRLVPSHIEIDIKEFAAKKRLEGMEEDKIRSKVKELWGIDEYNFLQLEST